MAITMLIAFLLAPLAANGQGCTLDTGNGIEVNCQPEEVRVDIHPSDPVEAATVALYIDADSEGTAIAFGLQVARESGRSLPSPEEVLVEIGDQTYRAGLVDGETSFEDEYRIEEKYVVVSTEMSKKIAVVDNFRVQIGDAVFDLSPAVGQMSSSIQKIAALDDNGV
jgi:hypothetical protein